MEKKTGARNKISGESYKSDARLEYLAARRMAEDGVGGAALAKLQALSDSGYSDADIYIGHMFERGMGVSKDDSVALRYFIEAEKAGNITGSYFAARNLERNGRSEESAIRLRTLALDDYPPAMMRLARALEYGRGVKQDIQESRRLLLKAKRMGHIWAIRYDGIKCLRGEYGWQWRPWGVALLARAVTFAIWLTLTAPHDPRLVS